MNTEWNSTRSTGVVSRRDFSAFLVLVDGKTISCRLSPRCVGLTDQPELQGHRAEKSRMDSRSAPAPAVGDRVIVEGIEGASGWITEMLPRHNAITRRSSGTARGQILAANIDQLLAFCALGTFVPEWHQLDRMLALAEIESIPAVVILSKADLIPRSGPVSAEIESEIGEYRRIGYPVFPCSAKAGLGIHDVGSILHEKTSLLMGKSGVGKSSLLNALFPEWSLRVAETGRFGDGRCTTSNAEWHPAGTGAIVDTPGIRKLSLWDADGVNPAYAFREMRPFVGQCRFGVGCRHMEEPGCAVRRAVESGRIGVRRFRSMLHLAEDRP
jgi:ribosome biogenesis GTPase